MSLRSLRNAAAFSRAQSIYDAMTPPEDGPSECPECGGRGTYLGEDEPCNTCCGSGYVNEDGTAFDPDEAQADPDRERDAMQSEQLWQGQER